MKSLSRIILLVFLPLGALFAQHNTPDIVFRHLNERNGLSYNIVNCFLRDSRGILWIGTYDGLNRYDGAHFYVFKQGRDAGLLIHNTIHALCEDQQGNIWGATDGGIFRYDIKAGIFRNYKTPESKTVSTVHNILCDRSGTIWASNIAGLIRYDKAKDEFLVAETRNVKLGFLGSNSIRKNGLVLDPAGNRIWLATREGISLYDINAQTLHGAHDHKGDSLFYAHSVSALSASANGTIWFFDNVTKEIKGFNPASRAILYRISIRHLVPNASGATLFEDSNHKIWFSSWSYDVLAIDYLKDTQITQLQHTAEDATSIAGNFFWCAREDEDGTVWLGTVGGISLTNSRREFYKVHRLSALIPDFKKAPINFIRENPADKTWWIASAGSHIIHFNPATGTYRMIDVASPAVNGNGKTPWIIQNICFIQGKTFLIAQNGVWQWMEAAQRLVPFELPAPYQSFTIRDIVNSGDSVSYFNDYTELLRWNHMTSAATAVRYSSATLADGQQPKVIFMNGLPGDRLVMVAANNWLAFKDNRQQLHTVKMSIGEPDAAVGYYTSLDHDHAGRIWLAKKGQGLICYDPSAGKTSQWRESDGLVFDHIMTATADHTNRIWCAAYNKFSVFDPSANSFYNFSLPLSTGNYGYSNNMIRLQNGNILTNIMGDAVEFFPEKLKSWSVSMKPIIGAVTIMGKEKLIHDASAIQLGPQENSVRIKFGILADAESSAFTLRYMLDGAENDWTDATPAAEAVYNSLRPGKYTFRLQARANDNSWESPETTLQFIVASPFYATAWFISLVVLLVAGGLYAFYRYRIHQREMVLELENKAQVLEKEKAMVMYENLKQHLNPHFLFNSLTSLGSLIRFDQALAGTFLDSMSKVYRYILKNRDNELVPLSEELRFIALYVHLQQTRFGPALQVNITVEEAHHYRKIAPVTMQNLVENAIKHNTAGPDAPLVIDIYVEGDYLVVRNNLQKKSFVETSNKQGLQNMVSLYHFLSKNPVIITEDEHYFKVAVPLL